MFIAFFPLRNIFFLAINFLSYTNPFPSLLLYFLYFFLFVSPSPWSSVFLSLGYRPTPPPPPLSLLFPLLNPSAIPYPPTLPLPIPRFPPSLLPALPPSLPPLTAASFTYPLSPPYLAWPAWPFLTSLLTPLCVSLNYRIRVWVLGRSGTEQMVGIGRRNEVWFVDSRFLSLRTFFYLYLSICYYLLSII